MGKSGSIVVFHRGYVHGHILSNAINRISVINTNISSANVTSSCGSDVTSNKLNIPILGAAYYSSCVDSDRKLQRYLPTAIRVIKFNWCWRGRNSTVSVCYGEWNFKRAVEINHNHGLYESITL